MDQKEKMETVGKAALSALKTQTIENSEKPVLSVMDMGQFEKIIAESLILVKRTSI